MENVSMNENHFVEKEKHPFPRFVILNKAFRSKGIHLPGDGIKSFHIHVGDCLSVMPVETVKVLRTTLPLSA
jgi:hypothetical protein